MIRILHVEDNAGDARMVRELLSEGDPPGFEVTHVDRVGDALQRLAGDPFDVVLLDLTLPDAMGLEAVGPLRKAAPAVPIVVLSGLEDEGLAVEAVRCGAQDYLIKGTESGSLLARSLRYAIERKRSESAIQHLADHDSLTGLPNRRLFMDRLDQALARTRRNRQMLGLLFLDLDQFKTINDMMGHPEADGLLKRVAERLRGCVRASDTVARLGGDEYSLILPEVARLEDIVRFVQKVSDALAAPFPVGGGQLVVTFSVGISLYPADGQDSETLLKKADAAMYRAKEHGGNLVEFFAPANYLRGSERLKLVTELSDALVRDEFSLHYQPQVDPRSGLMTGLEVLLRWDHPDLGVLAPAEFLPLAEETARIHPINTWVLKKACAQIRSWEDEGLRRLRVAVNVSTRDLAHGGLVETTLRALEENRLEPWHLTLELGESAILRNQEAAVQAMEELKKAGVRLAIDGFGTGYSSLSHLRRFPFDALKLDRSFIRDAAASPEDAATVGALITMAHSLEMEVVGVGVETPDQLAFLRAHDCDHAQGYYLSHPLPAQDVACLLRGGWRWAQV